jgi:hypothetical protein
VHPVSDGQVVDAHGSVVAQSPFGIQFQFLIQSCGLPVRQNVARFGLIDQKDAGSILFARSSPSRLPPSVCERLRVLDKNGTGRANAGTFAAQSTPWFPNSTAVRVLSIPSAPLSGDGHPVGGAAPSPRS